MDAGAAPHAEGRLEALPELVPADGVGAAELEGSVGDRLRPGYRRGEVGGDVVDPDWLDLLLARADDRCHGAQLCELAEGGQDAAFAAEDEARPEDHVLEAGALDRLLHLPFGVVVGDKVFRLLARPE